MSRCAVVTGAGGFLGGRLVDGLAARGWTVYAVTSRTGGVSRHPRVRGVSCSWTREGLRAALALVDSADLWVHAAARVDLRDENVHELYWANAALAELMARRVEQEPGAARLIYLSTISVYGAGQSLCESTEPQPDSNYGLSKLLGEGLCLARLQERCVVLRLAGVWGRQGIATLFVNHCLEQAHAGEALTLNGSGAGKRNYLWAGDLPRLAEAAFEQGWHGIRVAAGPEALSMRAMVEAIAARWGVPLVIEDRAGNGPEPDVIAEASRELRTTGFRAGLEMEVGGAR